MKSYRLMDKKRTYFLALAALCLIALFLFLGESSFHTRGEPREAVVAHLHRIHVPALVDGGREHDFHNPAGGFLQLRLPLHRFENLRLEGQQAAQEQSRRK